MRTSPASGRSRPATMLRSVDLPEPDSPTIAHHSPGAIARLTPARSGAPGPKRFSSARTSSMRGAGSEPGDDPEDGAGERAHRCAPQQPALLREHGDGGERDRDLQQRHRDREVVVRMQGLLAPLVELLRLRLQGARFLLDVLLFAGVALRFLA